MRIAQVVNPIESVPPQKYGGIERMVHALIEELIGMGHQVTLFASGDSHTSADLEAVVPQSLRAAKTKNVYGANDFATLNLVHAYKMADQFDIIHEHTNSAGLLAGVVCQTPVVSTLHGPFTTSNRKLFQEVADRVHLVAISHSQMKPLPHLPIEGVVYNGLPMEDYPFSDQHDGYLLFVGRISEEKGVHHAIEVAQYLDMPLIIAAKLETNHRPDVQYFKEYVEPRIDGQRIKWIGEVDTDQRNQLMAKAKAFLHPVSFREPFGLTLIEAMACGCPVVAFGRGSIRELIMQGKTGFVVEDAEEMVEAVSSVDLIDRAQCRQHALENFNAKRMAEGYQDIYQRILSRQPNKSAAPMTSASV